MDETPIQVLKEEDRRPQTKSYVWVQPQRTDEAELPPIIYFHYTPSRAGENAVEPLERATENTYLMVDGYSGYNKVNNIKHCCCYAHIRRKFYDAIQERKMSLPAVQAVAYCDKLFSYEREYKEKGFHTDSDIIVVSRMQNLSLRLLGRGLTHSIPAIMPSLILH